MSSDSDAAVYKGKKTIKYIHIKKKKIWLLYVYLKFMSSLKIVIIGNTVNTKIQLKKINRKDDTRKMEKYT